MSCMNTVGIAKFEKVPLARFVTDVKDAHPAFSEEEIAKWYDGIKLPTRATLGSAGYDICTPFAFDIADGRSIVIPTGLRVSIDPGWFLAIFPRSGLGFRFRAQLDNTIGIIDSDYYNAENFGHIMVKLTNDSKSNRIMGVYAGDRIVQGIFIRYGTTIDDSATGTRTGGMGSTGM